MNLFQKMEQMGDHSATLMIMIKSYKPTSKQRFKRMYPSKTSAEHLNKQGLDKTLNSLNKNEMQVENDN